MLDRNGFKRKTYNDLINDMEDKAKELFGADANTSERSVLGIILRIMAWFFSLAWMAIEAVYHSGYRKSAEGKNLDKLLPYAGITRILADYAMGEVVLTGTPNYTQEAGFIVGTQSDINFETIEDVTLDESGIGTVQVVATEIGSRGNVGANAITVIVEPNADIELVNNIEPTTGGRENETDQEARERADITTEGMGSGTVASINTELLKIDTVRAAHVNENDTLTTNSYGTPGKALQAFVLGGSDEEVAQAILYKKAGGIQAYGTTVVRMSDVSGHEQAIGFTRAEEINVYAKINVSTDNTFEAEGEREIKNTLVRYIGGERTDGALDRGLNMGQSVIYAKALAHVINVTGVTDAELELSIDGTSYSHNNIDVDVFEVAQIHADDIEVTINV